MILARVGLWHGDRFLARILAPGTLLSQFHPHDLYEFLKFNSTKTDLLSIFAKLPVTDANAK